MVVLDPSKVYINLDTSSLVALVSDLCNGAAETFLQKEYESIRPHPPLLSISCPSSLFSSSSSSSYTTSP